MTENAFEMIDALVDGERVDAEVLRRALADASGRDYLIDILALRDAMAQTSPKSQPDAAPKRPRTAWHRAIAWPAAAAVLVASLAAGFAAGYQFAGTPVERAGSTDVNTRAVGPVDSAARIDCARADARDSSRIGRRLAGRHGRRLRMRTLLLAGWVLAGQPGLSQQAAPPPQAPPTQQTPPSQEVRRVLDGLSTAVAAQFGVTLTLAAPVTRTDGRVSGASMRNLSQPFAYFVYSNGDLCGATTLTTVEPRAAMVGWRVTATSVTRTATQLVVKLDWQRLWDRGRALPNGPRGSTELVLQREDRVPVDFVAAPPSGWLRCHWHWSRGVRRSAGSCRAARRTRRPVAISTPSCGSSTVGPTASRTSSAWRFTPARRAWDFFSGPPASRRRRPR